MMKLFKNKKILVTGGIGYIVKGLIKKLLEYKPDVIRVFDINETGLFEFQQELKDYKNVRFLIGDVRDNERLKRAVDGVDIVFHLAALKHVISSEYNPFEAVKTNVLGIQNLVEAALEKNVERVILTSSDKAVNPSNTMGATKLLGERLITAANFYRGKSRTKFASIRFGNVIGSSGSIVPLFKKQIMEGGPVTITNTDMTRFVMPLKGAVELILQCAKMAKGGEIFILKMPVIKIIDLAGAMAELLAPKYGYKKEDIKIKIIGMKPGETLYEELLNEHEAESVIETEKMYIIPSSIEKYLIEKKDSYKKARLCSKESYDSKNGNLLSKEEIKGLLAKEGLL